MTQYINQITYTPTSQVNNQCVAVVECDASIDSDWKINTIGNDNSGDVRGSITPVAVIVDNLTNSNTATIIYGPQQYGVAPFTRRTFALPSNTPQIEVQVTSGVVRITLCEANMNVPDEQNQLASSGGNSVGEYNPFFFCVGITPVANQVLYTHYFEEPVVYQPNFNGFQGGVDKTIGTNPAAIYTCQVYKNGVHIGDLAYQTNGTCIATTVGGTTGTFAVGDCMTVVGNITPDGSILNFSGTFTMTPT